jgi:hypothetical protein
MRMAWGEGEFQYPWDILDTVLWRKISVYLQRINLEPSKSTNIPVFFFQFQFVPANTCKRQYTDAPVKPMGVYAITQYVDSVVYKKLFNWISIDHSDNIKPLNLYTQQDAQHKNKLHIIVYFLRRELTAYKE